MAGCAGRRARTAVTDLSGVIHSLPRAAGEFFPLWRGFKKSRGAGWDVL